MAQTEADKAAVVADVAADASRMKHKTPRWVIALGLSAALFAVAFVALHLLGGGFHGHGP